MYLCEDQHGCILNFCNWNDRNNGRKRLFSEHIIAHKQSLCVFMLKQTYRTIFICSCIVFIVDICRTTVRQSQNICMYIYMPACVWHILPIKRTSLCSSFRVFHKLITSRQQGKYDSSLIQTVSAVVVIIGISESVKDHKQRVWTGSSWFMSQAGKQQNFVDLCTLRTQKRSNVKHMAAAWSVDDSIQHVEKNTSEVALALFLCPPPPNFPKLLSFSAHVGWCFLRRFENILPLQRINCTFEATSESAENNVAVRCLLQNMEQLSWKCKSKAPERKADLWPAAGVKKLPATM